MDEAWSVQRRDCSSRVCGESGCRRPGCLVALTATAGVVLRVWAYRSAMAIPDSDEALVGLMVRHIDHGQFTTFYWGQAYGGPQEALLAVPGFLVFGRGWLALRIVPIALSALAALPDLAGRAPDDRRARRRRRGGALLDLAAVLDLQAHPAYDFYGTDVVYCVAAAPARAADRRAP